MDRAEFINIRQSAMNTRTEAMRIAYVEEGRTLEEIGEEWGISRERVRQLLRPVLKQTGRAVAKSRTAESRQLAIDELYPEVEKLAKSGLCQSEIIERLRDTARVSYIRQAMARVPSHIWRLRSRKQEPLFSDQELLDWIKLAAIYEGESTLSHLAYDRHAAKYGWPTWQTSGIRFGSWANACRLAGIDTNPTRHEYTNRISPETCLEAVVRMTRKRGELPTASQYEVWKEPSDPSLATVRHRLGKWSQILRLAHAELNGDAP